MMNLSVLYSNFEVESRIEVQARASIMIFKSQGKFIPQFHNQSPSRKVVIFCIKKTFLKGCGLNSFCGVIGIEIDTQDLARGQS